METTETTVAPGIVDQDDIDNLADWKEPQIPKAEFDKRIGKIREITSWEINTWKTEAEELKAQLTQVREEGEKKAAIAQFWEEVVNDEKVQEYRSKYPWMWYEEAVKLAWKEPKKVWSMFVARNPSNILNEWTKTITASELESMPEAQRRDHLARAKKGEIKIDWATTS